MAKRTSHLTKLDQISVGERKLEKKKGREKERRREKLHLLSIFPAIEPSVRVRARGKVGPRIESYAWVPKSEGSVKLREVGVFLLLGLIFVREPFKWTKCLGSGTTVQFSPKILGLNARIFRTVSDSPGLDFGTVLDSPETEFRDCFRQSWTKFWDCFQTIRN